MNDEQIQELTPDELMQKMAEISSDYQMERTSPGTFAR